MELVDAIKPCTRDPGSCDVVRSAIAISKIKPENAAAHEVMAELAELACANCYSGDEWQIDLGGGDTPEETAELPEAPEHIWGPVPRSSRWRDKTPRSTSTGWGQ